MDHTAATTSPAPVRLWLFRHGETDWNVERRFQGHSDIPLNATGRQQAGLLAARLAGLTPPFAPEVVLSSDLVRARATAAAVAEALHVPLVLDRGLREVNGGDAEGQLRPDLIRIYGEEHWRRWCSTREADMDIGFPQGESKRACLERARRALEHFVGENSYQTVAVATHGGALRYLVHACLDDECPPVAMGNCALYELYFERATRRWALPAAPAAAGLEPAASG